MVTKLLANWLTRTCSQTSIRTNLIAIALIARCSLILKRYSPMLMENETNSDNADDQLQLNINAVQLDVDNNEASSIAADGVLAADIANKCHQYC